MVGMFQGCDEFDGSGIENWDVSKVTDMSDMFRSCPKFNADLTKWNDLWKLEYASRMFRDCIKFEGKGVDKWETPALKTMVEMFSGCKKFNQDLSHWFVKNVTQWSYWAYDTPIYNEQTKWPKFN